MSVGLHEIFEGAHRVPSIASLKVNVRVARLVLTPVAPFEGSEELTVGLVASRALLTLNVTTTVLGLSEASVIFQVRVQLAPRGRSCWSAAESTRVKLSKLKFPSEIDVPAQTSVTLLSETFTSSSTVIEARLMLGATVASSTGFCAVIAGGDESPVRPAISICAEQATRKTRLLPNKTEKALIRRGTTLSILSEAF